MSGREVAAVGPWSSENLGVPREKGRLDLIGRGTDGGWKGD